MGYRITFHKKAYTDTMNLPDGILAQLLHIFELAETYGANLGRPFSAPLQDGLFEFRAKGEEGIARSIFVTQKGKEIVILHTFVKKTQKIPKKELELAKKRAKELK